MEKLPEMAPNGVRMYFPYYCRRINLLSKSACTLWGDVFAYNAKWFDGALRLPRGAHTMLCYCSTPNVSDNFRNGPLVYPGSGKKRIRFTLFYIRTDFSSLRGSLATMIISIALRSWASLGIWISAMEKEGSKGRLWKNACKADWRQYVSIHGSSGEAKAMHVLQTIVSTHS